MANISAAPAAAPSAVPRIALDEKPELDGIVATLAMPCDGAEGLTEPDVDLARSNAVCILDLAVGAFEG